MNMSVNGWGLAVWILRDVITTVLWSGEFGKGQSNWQVWALSSVPIKPGFFLRKNLILRQEGEHAAADCQQGCTAKKTVSVPASYSFNYASSENELSLSLRLSLAHTHTQTHTNAHIYMWVFNWSIEGPLWPLYVCVYHVMGLGGTVLLYKWMTSVQNLCVWHLYGRHVF